MDGLRGGDHAVDEMAPPQGRAWASSSTPGWPAYIQQTPGAIGYVEYAYCAAGRASPTPRSRTQAGSFVTPSQSSIAAAGAQASDLSASNFNIVNGPGAGTYPLANFSWTLIYQKQSNTTLGVVLGKLLDWVTTTGQQQAAALGYSPLPANVVSPGPPDAADARELGGQAPVLLIAGLVTTGSGDPMSSHAARGGPASETHPGRGGEGGPATAVGPARRPRLHRAALVRGDALRRHRRRHSWSACWRRRARPSPTRG